MGFVGQCLSQPLTLAAVDGHGCASVKLFTHLDRGLELAPGHGRLTCALDKSKNKNKQTNRTPWLSELSTVTSLFLEEVTLKQSPFLPALTIPWHQHSHVGPSPTLG